MNFTALNENNEVGWQLVANGRKTVTRRIFKRKCPKCKKEMLIQLIHTSGFPKLPLELLVTRCLDCKIQRKLIAVGDLIAVCAGRGKGPAICKCGRPFSEHQEFGIGSNDGCFLCPKTDMMKPSIYRPLKVQIVSLMKHGDWQAMVKKRVADKMFTGNGYDAAEEFKEEEMYEAMLEGFGTRQGWLAVYPKMKVEIGDAYRIEFYLRV